MNKLAFLEGYLVKISKEAVVATGTGKDTEAKQAVPSAGTGKDTGTALPKNDADTVNPKDDQTGKALYAKPPATVNTSENQFFDRVGIRKEVEALKNMKALPKK